MIRSAAAIEPFFLYMAAASASARVDAALARCWQQLAEKPERHVQRHGWNEFPQGAIWILGC